MKKIYCLTLLSILSISLYAHKDLTSFQFNENNGQFDSKVLYHCKLHIGNLFLEKDRFTFDLFNASELDNLFKSRHEGKGMQINRTGNNKYSPPYSEKESFNLNKHAYSMVFLDVNDSPIVTPSQKFEGYKNYFIGDDRSKWASNVHSFREIKYSNLYKGIDMEVYTLINQIKYDFIVTPEGDPEKIKIEYDNVDQVKLIDGTLVISLSNGEVKEMKPTAYQYINGKQTNVPCGFELNGTILSFNFPNGYDKKKTLTIDPTWIFSTLSGSTAENWGFTATYDTLGNLYGAGISFGTGYPTTTGAYQTTFGGGTGNGTGLMSTGFDISITKFNSSGTNLIYSTYIGGSGNEMPHSLINDSQNNLILLGSTSSSNYPTTAGAYDQSFNNGFPFTPVNQWGAYYANGSDICITKFNSTGSALLASTYIGGSDNEGLNESLPYNYSDQVRGEVILDDNDNVYVTSSLWSDDFPGTSNSINGGLGFGAQDGIVFKMNQSLSNLNWATYIGGNGQDGGYSVRISPTSGNVYVCGGTTSSNLQTSPGVINSNYGGNRDAYVASFNGNTGAPIDITYLGTSKYDQAFILDIDQQGQVYVTGQTTGNYPIINASFSNSNSAQFIHKISPDLTTTDYSTTFGSGSLSGPDSTDVIDISLTAFMVDNCGNVYVTGWGGGYNHRFFGNAGGNTLGLPVTSDAQQAVTDGDDFYFFVLERFASSQLYGSFLGDLNTYEHTDGGTSRFDPSGVVYQSVCAACATGDFPTTLGVWSDSTQGGLCNFGAIKFEMNFQDAVAQAISPGNQVFCSANYNVNFNGGVNPPPHQYWDFGDGIGSSILTNPSYTYSDTGFYQVMYVAIDSSTCNISDTMYFDIDLIQAEQFNAQFVLPTIDPCANPDSVLVQLNFTGSGADSIVWDMGNGTTFIDTNSLNYYYTNQGSYEITMTAWDFVCNNTGVISDSLHFLTSYSAATAIPPNDTTLCSPPPFNYSFNAGTNPPPNVYWDFGDGVGSSNLPNPTYTYSDTGTYAVMYVAIDSSTCNIADTVFFNVQMNQFEQFDAQFNLPTVDPCAGADSLLVTMNFNGSTADSIAWDLGNGTTFSDSTSLTYYYTAQGAYEITMTAWDFTCNNTVSFSDSLIFFTTYTVANAIPPNDTTLCSSPPFNFSFTNGNSAPPYQYWDFGDGIGSSNLPNPTYTYSDTGTYNIMYVAIDSTTCNIADTVYFLVNMNQAPLFTANFNLPDPDPCSNLDSMLVNLSFTGTIADSLHWDMGNGQTFTDSLNIDYFYDNQGIYVITLNAWDFVCNNTSVFTDTVNFIVTNTFADANVPSDVFLCSPPYDVNMNSGTNIPPYNYWDFGDGNTSTLQNLIYTYSDTGSYTVTYIAIDSSTCNISDTAYFNVTIEQAEQFSADLNFDPPPPCGSDSLLVELLFSGTSIDSLIWDMGNGIVFNSESVSYYYTTPGVYNISLTAFDLTCDHTETIVQQIEFIDVQSGKAIIPNVFTPNGDGNNDKLEISNINDSEAYEISIWNRWGNKIFHSYSLSNNWDGKTIDGKDAPEGVYYYIVKYLDICSSEEKTTTGFVQIMR